MKIISKYSDYYDGVSFSSEPCFVRHKNEVDITLPNDIKKILDYYPSVTHLGHLAVELNRYLIGFCGKVYPFFELKYSQRRKFSFLSDNFRHIIYSQDDLDKAFSLKAINPFKQQFFAKRSRKTSSHKSFNKTYIDEVFACHGQKIDDDIFFELQSPIFLIERQRGSITALTVNPVLKDYKFQRVFPSYQAYQEIEMYLGGVLGQTEIETAGISDKDLKHQKGFDRWSFKKMPTKRRLK